MTEIERLAKALRPALYEVLDIGDGYRLWDRTPLDSVVRAILTAMREPNEMMIDAAREHSEHALYGAPSWAGTFTAMIDAILNEAT